MMSIFGAGSEVQALSDEFELISLGVSVDSLWNELQKLFIALDENDDAASRAALQRLRQDLARSPHSVQHDPVYTFIKFLIERLSSSQRQRDEAITDALTSLTPPQKVAMIQRILRFNLPQNSVESILQIIQQLAQKEIPSLALSQRIHQMQKSDPALHGLTLVELVRIAGYYETTLSILKKAISPFSKKRPDELSRAVSIDKDRGLFFPIRGAIVDEQEGIKRMRAVLFIPLDSTEPPRLATKTVNVDRAGQKGFKMCSQELTTSRLLTGIPHVVRLISTITYYKKAGVPKACGFWDYYEGTVQQLIDFKTDLSREQHILFAKDIAEALMHFHRRTLIHGNLTPAHVQRDREFRPYLWSFMNTLSIPKTTSYGSFGKRGIYGNLLYSAPETLEGQIPFTGDVVKVEMWAFGLLLYQLWTKQKLPWEVEAGICEKEKRSKEALRILRAKILASLPLLNPGTDPYLTLIASLTDLDPKKRPDSGRVFKLLAL